MNDEIAHIIPDPDSSEPTRDYKFVGPTGSTAYVTMGETTIAISRYESGDVMVEALRTEHEDEPPIIHFIVNDGEIVNG